MKENFAWILVCKTSYSYKRQFGGKSGIFNVDGILANIDKLLSFLGVIMVL